MKLKEIREKIDTIDKEILFLLQERFLLVKKAKAAKAKLGLPIRDYKREKEILVELKKKSRELGFSSKFISEIYKKIIRESKRLQNEQ